MFKYLYFADDDAILRNISLVLLATVPGVPALASTKS